MMMVVEHRVASIVVAIGSTSLYQRARGVTATSANGGKAFLAIHRFLADDARKMAYGRMGVCYRLLASYY